MAGTIMESRNHLFGIVVQARMRSTRCPGKLLYEACGKSILELQMERLQRVDVDHLIIATTPAPEDDAIVAVAEAMGIGCFRGSEEDVLDRYCKAARCFKLDVVIRIPSDVPFIDPDIVNCMLAEFRQREDQPDYLSNLHPCTTPDGQDVEIVQMATLETAWREAEQAHEREHVLPFVWDNPDRFKVANWRLPGGSEEWFYTERWTTDYLEDVQMVQAVFEGIYPENPEFTWRDVFHFLDAHPEITAINQEFAGINWYRHLPGKLKTMSEIRVKLHPDE